MKTMFDWERIEAEYRAGMLSVKEVARLNGLSDGAIRKRAKRDRWERDLSAKVDARVKAALVRGEVRAAQTHERARTEKEVLDEAVATKVHVVTSHQSQVGRLRRIAERLEAQLLDAIENRDEIGGDIEIVTAGDQNRNREVRMKRAIELPMHVATLKDLSAAIATLIKIERQAFGLADTESPPPVEARNDEAERALEMDRNTALLQRLKTFQLAGPEPLR